MFAVLWTPYGGPAKEVELVIEILEPVRNGMPEVSALYSAGISNGLEIIRSDSM